MWKVSPSPLVKRKSSSIFPSLPRHLIFILCVAICPQAHSGQANVAYLAGGCFWRTEAVFQEAPGVTSVVSGYMQRAETIQITFDPSKTSYDKLLNLFWRAHNPTEVDSQGPDTGKQYRSAIFYVDEQQRTVAGKSRAQAQKSYDA
jgi:peptide-methionine (S)-S-oxide reductase